MLNYYYYQGGCVPNIIRSISYPMELHPLVLKAERFAESKNVTFGALALMALDVYLKSNKDETPLDAPQLTDYFTRPIGTEELRNLTWQQEDEILHGMDAALSSLKRDRQEKRDAEMRAKGLRPKP